MTNFQRNIKNVIYVITKIIKQRIVYYCLNIFCVSFVPTLIDYYNLFFYLQNGIDFFE